MYPSIPSGTGSCKHCRQPLHGRGDQKYCSARCRQAACRAKQSTPLTTFHAIDGEGITKDGKHLYILLACDTDYLIDPNGLDPRRIFKFLYDHFINDPYHAYVMFYAGYDWTQWLKNIPEYKARLLLTREGEACRTLTLSNGRKRVSPVRLYENEIPGWELKVIPNRIFQLRPMLCRCAIEKDTRCEHIRPAWMTICDTGSFWQQSLLSAIHPNAWGDDPICTSEEYEIIEAGKSRRASAELDSEMRRYTQYENTMLSRIMTRLDEGLRDTGIKLTRSEWYGPGAVAGKWLEKKVPRRKKIEEVLPSKVGNLAWAAYFGGRFEITHHGLIPGSTYEYDINSAYPYITSSLPCLLHGQWKRIRKIDDEHITIIKGTIKGSDPVLGAMLHRIDPSHIAAPNESEGVWYGRELLAAQRAGLIDHIKISEGWAYHPCDCKPPLSEMVNLYNERNRCAGGKSSPRGRAIKLILNSVYGKLAQSVGSRPYTNMLYAGLITSGCRTMILDAIATHPKQSAAVLMIATDALFFDEPHPSLPLGKELGQWDTVEHQNLTLFKPGVWWNDATRKQIQDGVLPSYKARGIDRRAFAIQIASVDKHFRRIIETGVLEWPQVTYTPSFAMLSARHALHLGRWHDAGAILHPEVKHTSNPEQKRRNPRIEDGVIVSSPYLHFANPSHPYSGPPSEFDFDMLDGPLTLLMKQMLQ